MTPGNYELADINKDVVYVGRSDRNLRARLLNHQKTGKYEYFRFTTAKNSIEAFDEECRGWHLRKDFTKNI